MPAPTTPLLDNFNRADGALGANWTQAVGSYGLPTIVSNQVSVPQFPSMAWATPFGNEQEVFFKAGASSAFNLYILLRYTNLNTAAEYGYQVVTAFNAGAASSAELFKVAAGVATSQGFFGGVVPAGDSYFFASAVADTISLYSGTDGVSYTLRQTWTGASSVAQSYIGFYNANNTGTATVLDDFGGGTINPPVAWYVG